ncbi:MAG TPA: AbrB/MazE/SpoVT family DNA-binding domain-containing protein [Chloroflexota bacterium]|nr:AbrB/MazE/SpoVT family DNA-binding domain-containing protein [Chloroflexota bacterium]
MAVEVKKAPRRRGYTRISKKNQITVPAEALKEAGLHPGDVLRVARHAPGELVLERELSTEEILDKYAGIFHGMYPPGYLDELRDEWD